MSVRLRHPETGLEFDAGEAAVPQWRRSGWVTLAEARAAAQQPAPNGNGAASPSAAKPNGKAENKTEE